MPRYAAKKSALIQQRSSGILLHPTSLPGPLPSGDVGESAEKFIKLLGKMNQTWWQMLPVNPIGDGYSPYSTISAMAGEPLLIGADFLRQRGWLTNSAWRTVRASVGAPRADRTNYPAAIRSRSNMMQAAFEHAGPRVLKSQGFKKFAQANRHWLRDYALFVAIAKQQRTNRWHTWPTDLRHRKSSTLSAARAHLSEAVAYAEFCQFAFDQQWQRLRQIAKQHGVQLMGDVPIFVSHGSADVWANQHLFCLDRQGAPQVVAGCPPDAFNSQGQLWGNALYKWPAHKKENFEWWTKRLQRMLTQFDGVRLDHFIGFYRYWEIPGNAKTAKSGKWRRAPGQELFSTLTRRLPSMPFIAEDLGAVIPPVRDLRDAFNFPGMKVLQFAFYGDGEAEQHKPHFYRQNAAAYPGTHDNETVMGWYKRLKKSNKKADRDVCQRINGYLGHPDPKRLHQAMITALHQSPANLSILSWQDLLGQGQRQRMNTPGVANGNWVYRFSWDDVPASDCNWLAELTRATDR